MLNTLKLSYNFLFTLYKVHIPECVSVQSTAKDKVSGFVLFTLKWEPLAQFQSNQILFTNRLLHYAQFSQDLIFWPNYIKKYLFLFFFYIYFNKAMRLYHIRNNNNKKNSSYLISPHIPNR